MARQPLPAGSGSRPLNGEEPRLKAFVRRIATGVAAYVASPNPAAHANNVLALVIASNQPFYPFYVQYVAGNGGGASLITLLSTPVFAAIPMIARRHEKISFATLPVAGLANAMLATFALGNRSGIELFLIPCLLAGVFAIWRSGWTWLAPVLLAITAAYASIHVSLEQSMVQLDDAEAQALYKLNAISVVCLSAFILYSCFYTLSGTARHDRNNDAPK